MKRYIKTLSAFLSLVMMLTLVGCIGESADTTAEDGDISAQIETQREVQQTEAQQTEEETQAPVQPSEWDLVREKAKNEGIKVLFIGDSLTHYNEMPQIFAALCKAAGYKVTADRQTKGGTGIAMLREDGTLEMFKTFGYEDYRDRMC